MVYLLEDVDKKYLKIGYSDNNPEGRLAAIKVETKLHLRIVYVINGTRQLERGLHSMFKNYHIKREWFWYSEDILNYFAKLYDDCENIIYRWHFEFSHEYTHSKLILEYLTNHRATTPLEANMMHRDIAYHLNIEDNYCYAQIIKLIRENKIKFP